MMIMYSIDTSKKLANVKRQLSHNLAISLKILYM
ncbi:unnamed protein product [Tenebrio molitor]|nr:unnamed protein product [Tenebrio molitor]